MSTRRKHVLECSPHVHSEFITGSSDLRLYEVDFCFSRFFLNIFGINFFFFKIANQNQESDSGASGFFLETPTSPKIQKKQTSKVFFLASNERNKNLRKREKRKREKEN